METQFDVQQKMLQQLQLQTGQTFLQTGLMAQQSDLMNAMAGSLGGIQAEMDAIRTQNVEGLAIQQEMLRREQLQSQLEEFIYNTQKMVAAFREPKGSSLPSVRYFTLKGVVDTVQQNGIGTALIKGRDNKAAFEQAMSEVHRMCSALERDPEVKEALAWAKAEQKRIEEKQRKIAAENQRKEEKRQQILRRITELKSSRKIIRFIDWYRSKIRSRLPEGAKGLIAQAAMWYLCGFLWIPVWHSIWSITQKDKDENLLNEAADREVAQLESQLAQIDK